MYDASGVRRLAGLQAERINALPPGIWPEGSQMPLPLSTNIGHTRLEVLVGGVLGVAVALVGTSRIGSAWHLLLLLGRWLAEGWGRGAGL